MIARASDRVGLSVIRWRGTPELLAYLVVRPPAMDLARYARPDNLGPEEAEQMFLDAVEHIFACHSV